MDPHSLTPSWSGLRGDLLLNIANRLDSCVDRLCFRAVCYSWRSILPPPARQSSPPLQLPFPMGPNPHLNPRHHGYFNLVESTVYCIQPLQKNSDAWKTARCWLIKIEEAEELGKVRLKDPLSQFEFQNLSPKFLNLLDYRVYEVTKVYGLRFVGIGEAPELDFPELKSISAMRVAVCYEGARFAVMATHTAGQLSIWRMGDEKWTCINDGRDRSHYEDVVYRDGKFYAVDYSGLTISVDFSLEITLVTPALPRCGFNRYGGNEKRLVNSPSNLFLLDKDSYPGDDFLGGYISDTDENELSTYFLIYKLSEEKRQWVSVESLGNRAMFVGDDCTFSVSAQDFRGCKKNCIYYTELFGVDDDDEHPGLDAALFDVEDCSAKPLSRVFGYSGLFWPPPSWLMTDDMQV